MSDSRDRPTQRVLRAIRAELCTGKDQPFAQAIVYRERRGYPETRVERLAPVNPAIRK
jgi:hypothetical protein